MYIDVNIHLNISFNLGTVRSRTFLLFVIAYCYDYYDDDDYYYFCLVIIIIIIIPNLSLTFVCVLCLPSGRERPGQREGVGRGRILTVVQPQPLPKNIKSLKHIQQYNNNNHKHTTSTNQWILTVVYGQSPY